MLLCHVIPIEKRMPHGATTHRRTLSSSLIDRSLSDLVVAMELGR